MKNNKYIFLVLIVLPILFVSLFGFETKAIDDYTQLNIGECIIEVSTKRQVVITKDKDMLLSSLDDNNVLIVHWKKKALEYLNMDLKKYNLKTRQFGSLSIIEVEELKIKIIVGNNFYITTRDITKKIMNNIVKSCNQSLKSSFIPLDVSMITHVFNINKDESERIEEINHEYSQK